MTDQAQRHSPQDIERIKQEADLIGLVGQHVKLTRRGREFVGLCPFHSESTPSFTVVPDKHFYKCFGCNAHGDAITWLREVEKLSFNEAIEKLGGAAVAARGTFKCVDPKQRAEDDELARRRKIEAARKLWDEATWAGGTIVEAYLKTRGLRGIVIPPALRFHPSVFNAEAGRFMPAMIGCVCARGQIVGVHRTYLRSDGKGKANVKVAKKMMGACRGGHTQLDNPGAKLVVAEGIETALSVKMACPWLPVWAALSLTNMDAPVPGCVTELILCADGDNKDPKAADGVLAKAAASHARPGRIVRVARPMTGMDFNDMVRGAA